MNKKILDIEVLRGIAVLFVVIHHANVNLFSWSTPSLARFYTYFGGAIGVDLFFAISGFVIARDLLPKLQQADHNTKPRLIIAFWVRRAWRLWPSAWLWLLITLLLVFAYNDSHAFGGIRANIEATIAGIVQAANFRIAEAFGQHEYGASFVYWSLSLEEQFYIALPLLVLLTRKYIVYAVGAIALLQIIDPRLSLYSHFFRIDALCLGVLLALFSRRPEYAIARPAFLANWVSSLSFILLLMVLLLMLGSYNLSVTPYRFSFIALLSAALVFVASYDSDLIFHRLNFIRGPLIWAGERSYAIYLTHIPCFFIVRETWHRFAAGAAPSQEQFLLFAVSAAGMILALSELNYRLIEVPLRKKGARIASTLATNPQNSSSPPATTGTEVRP